MNDEEIEDALDKAQETVLNNQKILLGLEENPIEAEKLLEFMKAETIKHLELEISDKTHSHQWVPDGDSWTRTVTACDCDYRDDAYTFQHSANCSKEKERIRRYTCYCGETKTIKVDS